MNDLYQKMCERHGPWYGDACAILQDIGGPGLRARNIVRKTNGLPNLDVKTYAAKNGIYYSIFYILCVQPGYPCGHPIYEYLKLKVGDDQYAEIVRMRDMTRLEFKALTEQLHQTTKTQKEKPYVNTIGSLAGQS